MCDRLAVIADDLTGSMDAAIMMWIAGWRVGVVEGHDAIAEDAREWDAVIFSAATRGVGPADAYAATLAGTAAFEKAGFARFYKKMSSTVQGNVGSELDAVLDGAGESFSVVVPAFPQNGRTTRGGVHYVRGVPVAETSLRYHPTSPITTSYLPDLLAAQTRRRIGRLDLDVVRRGLPAIAEELSHLHTGVELVLADAETVDDVGAVAAATEDIRVLAGASAFAGALRPPRARGASPARPRVDGPVLIVAGSVSETTAEQVRVAVAGGVPAVGVDIERLRVAPDAEVDRVADATTRVLGEAPAALIHTLGESLRDASCGAHPEADPAAARAFGARVGTHLGEIVWRICRGGLGALIIAGGDTSASVSARAGFVRHSIVAPFQMGVPITLSEDRLGRQALLTVMKSGNFGASDFFLSALSTLRAFQT